MKCWRLEYTWGTQTAKLQKPWRRRLSILWTYQKTSRSNPIQSRIFPRTTSILSPVALSVESLRGILAPAVSNSTMRTQRYGTFVTQGIRHFSSSTVHTHTNIARTTLKSVLSYAVVGEFFSGTIAMIHILES